LNNDITTAEVSPSEEADWLQCLLNSVMAAHRPEDTKRFGVGPYTLDEVSLLLALSLSETGAFSSQLRDHMWAAVARSELRLRDEVTGLFVGEKHQCNGWGVVTRQDVNAWLEVNEVGYRWDDPAASTCGSETPETNRTAETESTPSAMLAPEPTAQAEPAKNPEPPPLTTGKRWTPGKLENLRTYRKVHGTKLAAEYFQISPARVRELLPSDTPQPRGFSVYTHRPK
jgi:hypothetical protein